MRPSLTLSKGSGAAGGAVRGGGGAVRGRLALIRLDSRRGVTAGFIAGCLNADHHAHGQVAKGDGSVAATQRIGRGIGHGNRHAL